MQYKGMHKTKVKFVFSVIKNTASRIKNKNMKNEIFIAVTSA